MCVCVRRFLLSCQVKWKTSTYDCWMKLNLRRKCLVFMDFVDKKGKKVIGCFCVRSFLFLSLDICFVILETIIVLFFPVLCVRDVSL